MPHTNTWESTGLYRKFTGEVSGDEILLSNFELHSHPRFKEIKYIINDFSEITGHTITYEHTEVYGTTDDMISNTKGKLKIALVVSQPQYMDVAINYRDMMEDKMFECVIFTSIKGARKWVSIE